MDLQKRCSNLCSNPCSSLTYTVSIFFFDLFVDSTCKIIDLIPGCTNQGVMSSKQRETIILYTLKNTAKKEGERLREGIFELGL